MRRTRLAPALRRHRGTLAIVTLALGYALVMQSLGWAQTSYYALVKSLADGTPQIDRYHWETRDKSYTNGHFYSVKAPGMALFTLPLYRGLTALDAQRAATWATQNARSHGASRWAYRGLLVHQYGNDPVRAARVRGLLERQGPMVWALGLLGSVVPALLLLLLVRWVGDRVEPGFGVAAAVTLGLGTLIMPFATQFFGHVLAALLGFCAFALLWHERDGPPRPWLVAGAGVASGLAVTTEYPLALGGAILGVYAVSRGDVIRRGLAYAAGVAAGVAPLVAYNVWAFGSVTTFSYANAVDEQGLSGHATLGLNGGGFFGIGWPSPKVALELLFAPRGLLALTPVVALAAVGTVLLARRGRRAEAWVIGAVCAAYLTYDSGYWLPFGGGSPGPRFLIPMLPFLAVGLAAAYRRLPAVTLALAIPSALIMLAADLTKPLIGSDDVGVWARLVAQGDFEHTVLSALGAGNGWLALAPVLGAAALAVGLAVRATPPVALAGGLRAAALTVVGWALVAAVAPWALGHDAAVRGNWSALWLIVGAGAASLVVLGALAVRGRRRPVVDDAGTRAPAGARPAARAPQPEAARSR